MNCEAPFRDVLRLGSTGTQPVAVKRGLWRSGFRAGWDSLDGAAISAEVLGPTAVANLKVMQNYHGLDVDGVYGPATHKILRGSFDAYACFLYRADPQQPPVQLPATFTPTHQTGGLPGYPAIDVFAKPGAVVLAPADGLIRRLSGRPPAQGGVPGGAYGWSIYLDAPAIGDYFLTHFATRLVVLDQQVRRGDELGTVCDAAVARMPSSASHIHEGLKRAL